MLETAKEMAEPEKAGPVMAERLEAARGMLAAQGKKDTAEELARLAGEQAKKGYPHVGHSGAYRDAYWPAYRVVELRRFHENAESRAVEGPQKQ
jgi:hypothetical protein